MRLASIEEQIRELALSFPESYEDRPWGDFPVFKVGENKVFGWAVTEDEAVNVTVKLTSDEREIAHLLPYVKTASYVGRYGWITATGDGRGVARGRARVAPRVVLAQVPVGAARRRRGRVTRSAGNPSA